MLRDLTFSNLAYIFISSMTFCEIKCIFAHFIRLYLSKSMQLRKTLIFDIQSFKPIKPSNLLQRTNQRTEHAGVRVCDRLGVSPEQVNKDYLYYSNITGLFKGEGEFQIIIIIKTVVKHLHKLPKQRSYNISKQSTFLPTHL